MLKTDLSGRVLLDLKEVRRLYGGSDRWWRAMTKRPFRPLPTYQPGGPFGKLLFRRDELESWLASFRRTSSVDLDRLASEALGELRNDRAQASPHR